MTIGKSIIRQAPRSSIVRIVPGSATVTQPARSVIIQTGLPGPAGPEGPPGEPGPPGGGSGGGGAGFTWTQNVASALWTITHNLGYRPAVSVWDTSNDQVVGEVDHLGPNSLTIAFSVAISGTAYMS
jgi:hypothetical protein